MSPAARSGRRRRNDDGSLVVISWRDIPAQVNCGGGDRRVQRILPRRFQKAIDRAAMVAGKTQASQYVGEWRRTVVPADGDDPETAAIAAAADLEEAFPRERLNEFVKTGGWDPAKPAPDADAGGSGPTAPRDAFSSTGVKTHSTDPNNPSSTSRNSDEAPRNDSAVAGEASTGQTREDVL